MKIYGAILSLSLLTTMNVKAETKVIFDCNAVKENGVYSEAKLVRDTKTGEMTLSTKSLMLGNQDLILGKKGMDSAHVSNRVNLFKNDETSINLFFTTENSLPTQPVGEKLVAISIEDKTDHVESIGSQLEFFKCK